MGTICAKIDAEQGEERIEEHDEHYSSLMWDDLDSEDDGEDSTDEEDIWQQVSQMSVSSHFSSQSLMVNPEEVKQGKVLCHTLKSRVYTASWQGQEVVAKQLKSFDMSSDHGMSELLHEIHILSGLRHPCLVRMIGANLGSDAPHGPFMLTEFMEHHDVETYMQKQQQEHEDPFYRPGFEVAMGWARNTGQALRYLHGLPTPIIHRDLKPLNLFLTKDLQVKVGDFGISKVMPARHMVDKSPAPSMTGGVGTWRYMAPEVARHEAYTDKVDIYAYALIMYYIFSGKQPFHSMEVDEILDAFGRGEEPRPEVQCLSRELGALLAEAWHSEAALRPSAADCLVRLSDIKMPSFRQSLKELLGMR